jgi:hypothetical protein
MKVSSEAERHVLTHPGTITPDETLVKNANLKAGMPRVM